MVANVIQKSVKCIHSATKFICSDFRLRISVFGFGTSGFVAGAGGEGGWVGQERPVSAATWSLQLWASLKRDDMITLLVMMATIISMLVTVVLWMMVVVDPPVPCMRVTMVIMVTVTHDCN